MAELAHNNKTIVNLKAGLSFAWLDKSLNNKLKEIVGNKGRTDFIKKSAKEQFGIELETSIDFIEFDRIIKAHHYQDRADWLREICRNKIREKR